MQDIQIQIDTAAQKLEVGLESTNKNMILDAIDTFRRCFTFNKDLCTKGLTRAYTALCIVDPSNSIDYLEKAYKIKKDEPSVLNNFGFVMHKYHGQFDKAISWYEECLSVDPKFETAYLGICDIFESIRLTKLKEEYINMGLKNLPSNSELWNLLGLHLVHGPNMDLQKSRQVFAKALSLEATPATHAKVLMNQGHVYSVCGDVENALKCYTNSITLNKNEHLSYGNILLNIQYLERPDHLFFTTLGPKLFQVAKPSKDETVPQLIIKYQTLLMDKLYGDLFPQAPVVPWEIDDEPLRVGFIGADFVGHAVSCFTEALFANLHGKVKMYMYSNTVYDAATTNNIKCELFRCIKDTPSAAAASVMRDIDKIHILIDLSGHTSGNRMDIIAHRPAPTILTYCGYPNDLGFKHTRRISDEYTERYNTWSDPSPLDLKRVFLCYTPPSPYLELPFKSYDHYNPKNSITLGCFGKLPKINSTLIRLWREILMRYPQTRLILKSKFFADEVTLNTWKSKFGGCVKRVVFHKGTKGSDEHMRLFNVLDLHLDTWPYSGTTITTESLFMNVPVLTIARQEDGHVSRVSASIVSSIGLEKELVAVSFKDYTTKLTSLIDTLPNLNVRERMLKSPFMDGQDLGNKFYDLLLSTNTM